MPGRRSQDGAATRSPTGEHDEDSSPQLPLRRAAVAASRVERADDPRGVATVVFLIPLPPIDPLARSSLLTVPLADEQLGRALSGGSEDGPISLAKAHSRFAMPWKTSR